jgi:hypothetical protein
MIDIPTPLEKMKRFAAILISCVVFSVLSVNAQKVCNLVSVEKIGNGFYVKATNGEQKAISPYTYKQVKKALNDYYMVTYDGEQVSDWTLAHKSKVSHIIFEVDSIGYNEDSDVSEVFLSNGELRTKYESPNEVWLKVNKGQHVESWYIDGITKIIEHWRTVPRETPLTTEVPIEAAVATASIASTASTASTTTTTFATTTQPTQHRFVKR